MSRCEGRRLAGLALALVSSALFGWTMPAMAAVPIGPAPAWVKPIEVPTAPMQAGQGVEYLLTDEQVRVGPGGEAQYRHLAERVHDASGLEDSAHVEIHFNPSFEKLTLHHVDIVRDGRRIGALKASDIKVLRREKGLDEELILDGRETANLFLNDVRVGDIIDYAYTLEGSNPVFGSLRQGRFEMQYGTPVQHVVRRLLWPAGTELKLLAHNGAPEARVTRGQPFDEYVWDRENVPSASVENDAPGWYEPYAAIEWSNVADWTAVVKWALPLYKVPTALGPQLAHARDEIAAQYPQPQQRVAAALRMVQGQVRYLGVEVGANAFVPQAPDKVYARRWGDCKDKTLLLVTLLRSLGVDAAPALVDTVARATLADLQPAPDQFDHVITQVRLDGMTYWIDPTRNTQQGRLDKLSQSDYGRALVVRPETQGLVEMGSGGRLSRREIDVRIDASGAQADPASMTVRTRFSGLAADRMRTSLAGATHEQMQKNFLNFYLRRYPGIEVEQAFEVSDDGDANELTLTEHYRLDKPWVVEPGEAPTLRVYSGELREDMNTTDQPHRSAPLAVDFPVDDVVRNEVLLPKSMRGKDEDTKVDGPGVRYAGTVRWPEAGRVVIEDHYTTLADHVSAADARTYNERIEKARGQVGYHLYYPSAVKTTRPASNFNWLVALLGVCMTVGWVSLARRAWRYDPEPPPSVDGPQGLSGWLGLFGLLQLVSVGRLLWALWKDSGPYGLKIWAELTLPGGARYDPVWAPSLLYELGFNLLVLVLAILVLALLLRRRSSLPRVATAVLWIAFFGAAIDDWLQAEVSTGLLHPEKTLGALIGAFIATLLWSAYLRRSSRVRNTCRVRLHEPPVVKEEPVAPAALPADPAEEALAELA